MVTFQLPQACAYRNVTQNGAHTKTGGPLSRTACSFMSLDFAASLVPSANLQLCVACAAGIDTQPYIHTPV